MSELSAFFGTRGTEDWITDQRPKSWRETILFQYPNGDAPLTALMSLMGKERLNDPEFNWWTEKVDAAYGTIVDINTDALGGTPYVTGGSAGDTLYVDTSIAHAKQVRIGHQVLLRYTGNYYVDVNCEVTSVTRSGTSGFVVVLLEDDDNDPATTDDLSDADEFLVIGNINEEGGAMPNAVMYNPAKFFNYSQIFRTPLSITRTAEQTKLRTNPNEYQKQKMQALERHGIEMELALWHGIRTETIDATSNKAKRTTQGIIPWIKEGAPTNISDFSLLNGDTTFDNLYPTTTKWSGTANNDVDGYIWFMEMMERCFKYGGATRMAFCGAGALMGIQRMAAGEGDIQIENVPTFFGMNFRRLVTPFGDIMLKLHPLWRNQQTARKQMVVFNPQNLKYRHIQDTKFYADKNGNNSDGRRTDGKDEEFLTEMGLEQHHPEQCAILNGIGDDVI